MRTPYLLKPHLNRSCKIYLRGDPAIPPALYETASTPPDLSGFTLPLPSRKCDYTCFAETDGGVMWYGAKTGLTRYDPSAQLEEDIVMFFSAQRDLADNNVISLLPLDGGLWVQTEEGASFIEMKLLSGDDKANILLDETLDVVERRGMVSHRNLQSLRDISSRLPYAHCDNDGCFTAGFSIAETLHYATLKREKGENDPETKRIKDIAVRSSEACLLLMNIAGRGNGFVARTYHTIDEPIPDDGLFFRKLNGRSICLDTNASRRRHMSGFETDASYPVPDRLAKLYRDLGFTDDEIIYKGDTSSDEITLHFLQILFTCDFLCDDDDELRELAVSSAKATLAHILDNGCDLVECDGKPTTWAKWDKEYFETGLGWSDACLNAAELLMYIRIVMHVSGEKGKWQEAYDRLIADGYADLAEKHLNRFYHSALCSGCECREDLMYGDHMLATSAFWALCTLEDDPELLAKYRRAFTSWRSTFEPEHNPGYDLPYLLACPDAKVDMERIATWFYRTNVSRLAAGVSTIGRHDIAKKILWGGYTETSSLLTPDECFIAKYDRNPLEYICEDSGGAFCVESCYVYTFAYWIGRYYGFIQPGGTI